MSPVCLPLATLALLQVIFHKCFLIKSVIHRVVEWGAIAFSGKTIALTIQTFVGKVMSLLFNTLSRFVMEEAMAPHSSTLAWKIPWTEWPGGLQSMGSLGVGHD